MLPRKAKGRRPAYTESPHIDKLISMVMALAGELQVTRERLDTLERVAASKGVLTQAEIDGYVPSEAEEQERHTWRVDYLDRILWIIQEERQAEARKETWEGTVAEVDQIGKW